jgi:hypothetical protein
MAAVHARIRHDAVRQLEETGDDTLLRESLIRLGFSLPPKSDSPA